MKREDLREDDEKDIQRYKFYVAMCGIVHRPHNYSLDEVIFELEIKGIHKRR